MGAIGNPVMIALSHSILSCLLLLQMALRLLDCEFADETVRAFGVKVLETLPDAQLEDYLIQLTQVHRELQTKQLKLVFDRVFHVLFISCLGSQV